MKYFENEKIHIFLCESDNTPTHTHPFLELAYVKQGTARHVVANKEYIIRRGDFFIIDYNTAHAYERIGDTPLEVINCLFLPEFIDPGLLFCDTLEKLLRHYLIRMKTDCFRIDPTAYCFHDDGSFYTLLASMLWEYEQKEAGYTEILRAGLITVLIRAVRRLPFEEAADSAVAEAEHYIRTRFAEHITLTELARSSNYSLPHFCQKFKKETGLSFTAYLRRTRMEEACRLLANTDGKIIDIAAAVGYRDVDSFLAAFRESHGMSPRTFRTSAKKK